MKTTKLKKNSLQFIFKCGETRAVKHYWAIFYTHYLAILNMLSKCEKPSALKAEQAFLYVMNISISCNVSGSSFAKFAVSSFVFERVFYQKDRILLLMSDILIPKQSLTKLKM